ncbi:hypothetical protein niasHT_004405 [Heterodera trifolii]|uniref:Uncharacterized protein n=1 Tax=Heterodera trifolii TaxID=157864 RepID=A0ABD2LM34_9BILA
MMNKIYTTIHFLLLLTVIANKSTNCATNVQGTQTVKTAVATHDEAGKISCDSSSNSDEDDSTTAASKMLLNEANHAISKDNDEPISQQQKMRPEANFSVKYLPPRLNAAQIDNIAQQASSMITLRTLKHVKEIFSKFAPDSWLEALEDIPLPTIRCTVKVSTKVRLFQQQLALKNDEDDDEEEEVVVSDGSDREGTTEVPETMEIINSLEEEEAAKIQTKEQLMNLLKSKCPRGFSQIVAFNEAINETLRQLPPHVHQIFEKHCKDFKNVSSFFHADTMASIKTFLIELLEDMKSITSDEREQIGEIFPKLRDAVTDPKIDQLIDQTIECVNGSKIACQNASQLAAQIWTSLISNGKKVENFATQKPNLDSAAHFTLIRAKRQDMIAEPEMPSATNVDNDGNGDGQTKNDQPVIYSPDDQPIELQFS